MLVTGATVAGLGGAVWVYDLAASVGGDGSPAATAPAGTAPFVVQPGARFRWAPCAEGAVLERGRCVTTVTRLVALPGGAGGTAASRTDSSRLPDSDDSSEDGSADHSADHSTDDDPGVREDEGDDVDDHDGQDGDGGDEVEDDSSGHGSGDEPDDEPENSGEDDSGSSSGDDRDDDDGDDSDGHG